MGGSGFIFLLIAWMPAMASAPVSTVLRRDRIDWETWWKSLWRESVYRFTFPRCEMLWFPP